MDKVKTLSLLHWLIIAIGIILLGAAYIPYYKDPTTSISFLQTSLVSIACSLFASTFISLLSDYYIKQKKYDSLVLDTYQNVDGNVFVGPHVPKKLSQQTIMYHFKKNSKGSEYFQNIFEKLWNDKKFIKDI